MKIKLDEGAIMPTRAHKTDAGLDLYTPIDFRIRPYGNKTIDTGVHVQLPPGTVGLLKSKSGLWIKKGVASGEGVVDEGYTGSIKVKVVNNSHDYQYFERGDKISQLLIVPYLAPDLELVDELDESERGDNGFGSTGSSVYDNVRTPSVESNVYDIVEEHHNCLVQILRNSVTGETSFGWKKEESPTFYAMCEYCKYFNGDGEFGRFGRCVKRSKTVWGGSAYECFEQKEGENERNTF